MPETVYLALGSNLGDRLGNLRQALNKLSTFFTIKRFSTVYETAPLYNTDQPVFYNMVCQGETALAPHELLTTLQKLEAALGRGKGERFGPRVIDIDILVYGSRHIKTGNLIIPHPRISERAFVLVPLSDLDPNLTPLPGTKTVQELLQGLGDWHELVKPAGVAV